MSSTVSAPVFDKKKHVLLIPDLFPIHMELLANVIRASGYRVEVLRTSGAEVKEAGLKYIHNDMCYPAICSLGQQLHAITSGAYDPREVALVQFQTGGGCRASNYSMILRKALDKLGLEIPTAPSRRPRPPASGSGSASVGPLPALRSPAAAAPPQRTAPPPGREDRAERKGAGLRRGAAANPGAALRVGGVGVERG